LARRSGQILINLAIKPYRDYCRFKEILNRVTDAALNRTTIEIVYFTVSRKEATRRKVDPCRVWFFNGTFYLIGLCHM